MKYRNLNYKGVELDKKSLENYLEKLSSDHVIQKYSNQNTYPIPKLKENFEFIKKVYHMLNEHVKLEIPIHPAGEWLLDNFYIIEETMKNIIHNMTLKKYKNFLGIANGKYKGFARIYILAHEIINHTDNNINYNNIITFINAYQKEKMLTMQEIWNLGIFMQISIIQNITDICEKIYFSQIQKYRAENIIERLVEKKEKEKLKFKNLSYYKLKISEYDKIKYPFIEHLSYRLKEQGKSAIPYIMALEEQVNKMGTNVDDVIKKEHYNIALKKVSIANCILSIKELLRMDFLSIFEETNGVEEILKQDPLAIYSKMDYKTKEHYRKAIEEIAKKTKIAEIYIASKALELAKQKNEEKNIETSEKEKHIGYYLLDEGKVNLYQKLEQKKFKLVNNKNRVIKYITIIWTLTLIIDYICMINLQKNIKKPIITILLGITLVLPIQEIIVKIVQSILAKKIKPKLIPKMDFYNGVPKECSTFVVIPIILDNKEKVKEIVTKLETYYCANKSENIYYAILGDCTSGKNKKEDKDQEIIEEGIEQIKVLNEKYKNKENEIPKFNFIYRERIWNSNEECYLGWERKRGLLNQFNEYLLGKIKNPFLINTIEDFINNDNQNNNVKEIKYKLNQTKYIITLDSDTQLVLNTAFELIGAMAHILNKPILNKSKNLVEKGYGIIQPRIGINQNVINKSLFTKIFAANGGIDLYGNAISDIYQDNFEEGIFTGKGIYDVKIFSEILNNEIPENTVLSHDLLEGNYLRCGLSSDIVLMDGYPSNYNSFKIRQHRWIRGDFQIARWANKKIIDKSGNVKNNPLNILSKYKIIDNILRTLTPIFTFMSLIGILILNIGFNVKTYGILTVIFISIMISSIIDIINKIIYHKQGEIYPKTFASRIPSWIANIERDVLKILSLPDKVNYYLNAIIKTIYRLNVSKKHLLEWTTSEDAEKLAKKDIISYYKSMVLNTILGIIGIIVSILFRNNELSLILFILSILWLAAPGIFYYISKDIKTKQGVENISKKDKNYLLNIGEKTWKYFKDTLIEENNYLPPDNYQEDRKQKFVDRTSSTNIGLALLTVISSYDLGYENLEETLKLLDNMIEVIKKLPKWNGHLYNWYNIKTLEPLIPRYISTVDSGNFVGYVYTLQQFLKNIKQELKETKEENKKQLLKLIPNWVDEPLEKNPIANANFMKLYDKEKGLFSIGYNIEENKLTDSYYDLLASEARQASLIAISKKDVEFKHWKHLSRTMTTVNGYSGLISWSGTAFEYLMPNVIIKNPKGSLLNESVKFMIMSQKEYAKKLKIPWGFSETAYYLKDLNNNYQYKAIGIPWLGLKRGLEEDIVVSSYSSIMAISEDTKSVIENIRKLEAENMYGKYGFYESIDYTPIRMKKQKTKMIVNTYMAHHQALILLSINNFFNNNILQKRFSKNPEIAAIEILLQENVPENKIITREEKIKPIKIIYQDYENYAQRIYQNTDINLPICNVISNDNYTIVMDERGQGYSKYKNKLINKYKNNAEENQGIFFYIKNIKNKKIWTANEMNYETFPDKYEIKFSEDSNKITRIDGDIQSKCKITLDQEDPIEIRTLELENMGKKEQELEVTAFIEPILSKIEEYNSHPAFQNLFLTYEYLENENIFVVKRKNRNNPEEGVYLAVSLYIEDNTNKIEYEIDKKEFNGKANINIPEIIENSNHFSNKIKYTTNPILAMKKNIKLKKSEKAELILLISVSEQRDICINNVRKYQNSEKVKKAFELAIAKSDTETRYLNINANQIKTYQKILGYILFNNQLQDKKSFKNRYYPKEELWQYGISGDLPILLVKVQNINEEETLKEVLKAYQFFRLKNIELDLVICNKESNSYEKHTRDMIYNCILNANLGYLQNMRAGIFVFENENPEIVEFYSKLTIDLKYGTIERQLKDLEDEYIENIKQIPRKIKQLEGKNQNINNDLNNNINNINSNINFKENKSNELMFYNEFGGFASNGKEYKIFQSKENKIPIVWSHIMANDNFGTLVTDTMGGYTWSKNSRLNRLTSLSNNPVLDEPSEIIYMQDAKTLETWSIGFNPMPDNNIYEITYGFGFAIYHHINDNIDQKLTTFIPKEDSVKISILELKNLEPNSKKINLVYYIKPVLGEDELKSSQYIDVNFKKDKNVIVFENKINVDFKQIGYVSSNEKIKSFTNSKKFFVGKYNISNPEGVYKTSLDNNITMVDDTIVAVELEIELESFENKKIILMMGIQNNILEIEEKTNKYIEIINAKQELENIKKQYEKILEKIQVNTPVESFNILLNGWLIYQTIVSRMKAKTGFYQSGGAFGFRDQLQDTIALKYFDENIVKEQIIKHCKHQFIQGDVEHWWHEETKKGIRTKYSDDALWLVYIVEEYINYANDVSILDEVVPYVKGEILKDGIYEKYDKYEQDEIKENVYMHCKRAIDKSLNFGENGLPKIGTGDWNDGFNNVGKKGKGESVWLGFFLYDILKKWIEIYRLYKNEKMKKDKDIDDEQLNQYISILEKLKRNLNTNGWDKKWYKRAYTDDGKVIGSADSKECKIDSISQSWAIISDAGDNEKKQMAIRSLEENLIDKQNEIIKLLNPPFEKGDIEPGYIKAYMPGIRENGGQYTHAAIWAIIAEAILGFGDKAMELFTMINPIEKTSTKEKTNKYKVEPYVIAGDIYGQKNLAGTGGWTWYTGSASWMYEAGIHYILGLTIEKGYLSINPCIPKDWREYNIEYKYKESIYNINIFNYNKKNTGVETMIVNGQIIEEKKFYLENKLLKYNVEIYM